MAAAPRKAAGRPPTSRAAALSAEPEEAAASAFLQPIGDSPLARGMGDYAEVFSLLFIIQLSVGAMFLLLVAQLLTVANLTVMLR